MSSDVASSRPTLSPIALGQAYNKILAAPECVSAVPLPILRLCTQVLADPRTCSDAALIVADALQECADDAHVVLVLPRQFELTNTPEADGLRWLAGLLRDQAPLFAGTCGA